MELRTKVFLLLAVLFATVLSAPARADPAVAEQKAAAEALYDEGLRLKEAGRYLEAAARLEQSQDLDPGVGTLLHLGDAYEKADRLASAWASFRQAAALAQESSDPRRRQIATDRAARLGSELAALTLDLGANVKLAGLRVVRDGVSLDPGATGAALPIDAGSHEIEVTAPGHEPHRETITVVNGQALTLTVPPLVALPAEAPLPVIPPGTPASAEGGASGARGLRIGALTLGIGSVVAAGVAVGFTVRAVGLDRDAASHCDGTVCRDVDGEALSHDAVQAADVATGAVVVASAAGAGALGLLLGSFALAAPEAAALAPWRPTAALSVTPLGGRGLAGLVARGSF